MVSAYYCGDLINGKYQFTVGRGNISCDKIGFFIPHSGRIKKIKVGLHGNLSGPRELYGDLFSIILFKNEEDKVDLVGTILTTYKCFFGISHDDDDGDIDIFRRRCVFEKIIKKNSISEGYSINIRTEKFFPKTRNQLTYTSTFLIE